MADEIAQTQNPENALDQNFVPGASCSLAAQECFQNKSLSFSWLFETFIGLNKKTKLSTM